MSCPVSCRSCKQYDICSECKPGFSNTQKLCTCRRDIYNNSAYCNSCTNTSFYPNDVEAEKGQQPNSTEALGGGIGGGVVALAVIVVVGLCLLRRR
ncbi:hypothetical protein MAR_030436 [Mya arenaria]|uniref:Uncharacterized protein n=1 Tax=Mya arenaria TaxID=6604 RepID=A0ABY7F2K0_MYAAR|nr:hypothetical protein MAR_030436 [Mya arenaria]